MKAVLFGATRGMGRALARRMAERGDRLFLLGRTEAELSRSARDLEIHGALAPVRYAACDLLKPETFVPALDAAERELAGFDAVVVTAGMFAAQPQLEDDPQWAARLMTADYTNTVLFCEEARKRLQGWGGTLCVFSSVAGERGRKPVVIYGSAKAGLSRYLEGLDHKFRRKGLKTVCVKPGFVKTGMTAGVKPPPFAGNPDEVARRVLRALRRGKSVVYAPSAWRWVMCVIRNLPRCVMRRVVL
jgi:decaprenylphospho-beta-D-erythro-pentofuranosid-2-ulose 2-reductase